jgi:hypothetical protein
MKRFRFLLWTLSVVGILVAGSTSAHAQEDQWPRTFFIGTNHVRCDLPPGDVNRWPHALRAVRDHAHQFEMPLSRFDQLEDLDLDLAVFSIDGAFLIPPPPLHL